MALVFKGFFVKGWLQFIAGAGINLRIRREDGEQVVDFTDLLGIKDQLIPIEWFKKYLVLLLVVVVLVWGYKLAGYDVIGANDIDPQMTKVYKKIIIQNIFLNVQ